MKKLNLRSREVTLGNGLRVRLKPLTRGAQQQLLGLMVGGEAFGDPEKLKHSALNALLTRDKAQGEALFALVDAHAELAETITVETDQGERAGTLADIGSSVGDFFIYAEIAGHLLSGAGLTELEAKN